ncbi:MAG: hypothetical protein PF495_08490 [Spirochaetales bacterium]|jgi:hypothetical protein|nr:hypothetical protein [Spirochaetales bacterium]
MKVLFAIPSYEGKITVETTSSMLALQLYYGKQGLKYGTDYEICFLQACPYISIQHNRLVSSFMNTDATDFFMIHDDIGFKPKDVINILNQEEDFVSGAYPRKGDDKTDFPVKAKPDGNGNIISKDGLIEAEWVQTGFLRIKRTVFEKMQDAYPELKYIDREEGPSYDLFAHGINKDGIWVGDDYAFCDRWTAIGGKIWIYPDIDFSHIGKRISHGNFHKFLIGE